MLDLDIDNAGCGNGRTNFPLCSYGVGSYPETKDFAQHWCLAGVAGV
jgi:hypothetical protein